jgi:hypothetical protein
MTFSPAYRRILQRMGYYDYQQGLVYRHLVQENGWHGHEKRCREYILKAVERLQPEKITVLGSGWLLDLPLSELSERTKRIILADIVHPPTVREQVQRFSNVELQDIDISGGLIQNVWNKTSGHFFFNRLKSYNEIQVPELTLDDPGLLISLNILTQIESLPLRFLEGRVKKSGNDILDFRKHIQEKHLALLLKHKSVLISDIAEVFTDRSGSISEVSTLLADMPEGLMEKTWQWDFDLRGSDFNMKKTVLKVRATSLLPQ